MRWALLVIGERVPRGHHEGVREYGLLRVSSGHSCRVAVKKEILKDPMVITGYQHLLVFFLGLNGTFQNVFFSPSIEFLFLFSMLKALLYFMSRLRCI